jgi:alpha-maltose-1-phosphate synthase
LSKNLCNAAEDPNEYAVRRVERKVAEIDLADHVLCPSSFVQGSLPQDRRRCSKTIPLAIERGTLAANSVRKPVFLFVGNITMRKGVHRLLRAWKQLKAFRTHELRLIGDMFLSKKFLEDFRDMFTHFPRISHRELDRHYAESSVFVFNSAADGFGQVILEAMSNGLPVIASRNCGAPDIIEHGREGLLIEYGNDDQLCAALEDALASANTWREMGKAAFDSTRSRTWTNFAKEFLPWIEDITVRTDIP